MLILNKYLSHFGKQMLDSFITKIEKEGRREKVENNICEVLEFFDSKKIVLGECVVMSTMLLSVFLSQMSEENEVKGEKQSE